MSDERFVVSDHAMFTVEQYPLPIGDAARDFNQGFRSLSDRELQKQWRDQFLDYVNIAEDCFRLATNVMLAELSVRGDLADLREFFTSYMTETMTLGRWIDSTFMLAQKPTADQARSELAGGRSSEPRFRNLVVIGFPRKHSRRQHALKMRDYRNKVAHRKGKRQKARQTPLTDILRMRDIMLDVMSGGFSFLRHFTLIQVCANGQCRFISDLGSFRESPVPIEKLFKHNDLEELIDVSRNDDLLLFDAVHNSIMTLFPFVVLNPANKKVPAVSCLHTIHGIDDPAGATFRYFDGETDGEDWRPSTDQEDRARGWLRTVLQAKAPPATRGVFLRNDRWRVPGLFEQKMYDTSRRQNRELATLTSDVIPEGTDEADVVGKPYRVDEYLGEGAHAIVWGVSEVDDLSKRYALKVLRLCYGEDKVLSRFKREARVLRRYTMDDRWSPYLIDCYDHGFNENGMQCQLLEKAKWSLKDKIEEYDRRGNELAGWSIPRCIREFDRCRSEHHARNVDLLVSVFLRLMFALSCVRNILSALEKLHEGGVVHRDIKPANILFLQRGQIKLADLGALHIEKEDFEQTPLDNMGSTQRSEIIGTHGYMPPNSFELAEPRNFKADVFSTGVVFREILFGLRVTPETYFSDSEKEVREFGKLDDLIVEQLAWDGEMLVSGLVQSATNRNKERRWSSTRFLDEVVEFEKKYCKKLMLWAKRLGYSQEGTGALFVRALTKIGFENKTGRNHCFLLPKHPERGETRECVFRRNVSSLKSTSVAARLYTKYNVGSQQGQLPPDADELDVLEYLVEHSEECFTDLIELVTYMLDTCTGFYNDCPAHEKSRRNISRLLKNRKYTDTNPAKERVREVIEPESDVHGYQDRHPRQEAGEALIHAVMFGGLDQSVEPQER